MRQRLLFLALLITVLAVAATAQDRAKRWDIMTSHEIGADRFKAKYPDFDGRGVVIAVLDTGVDMGVEGLKVLPTGKPKVVDVRDFSTEGDLYWEEHLRAHPTTATSLGALLATGGASRWRSFLGSFGRRL